MNQVDNFLKLNQALEDKIEQQKNKIENSNKKEKEQIEQLYNVLKEQEALTFFNYEEEDINRILTTFHCNSEEINYLIKGAKFLIMTKNNLDESMAKIFMQTEQYQTTLEQINIVFNNLKNNVTKRYEEIKNKNEVEEANKLLAYKTLQSKIANNEFKEIIDDKQEIELLFSVMEESTLTIEEQISLANNLLTTNINKYQKNNIQEQNTVEVLKEEKEQVEQLEENITSLQPENLPFLTEEDRKNLSLLESIVKKEENREKYDAIHKEEKSYLETVIRACDWLNNPSYSHYQENLFLSYFNFQYKNIISEINDVFHLSETEKEEYLEVIHEDIKNMLPVLTNYMQKYNLDLEEEQEITKEKDYKQHLFFLTNEDSIPLIKKDIEEENKIVIRDTIKTLEKLRLGANNGKNTNYSNAYYTTHKIILYREFCSSGVIEVAYVPIGEEDLFVIGACSNSRDNLRNTRKIDKVIGTRLLSEDYKEQLAVYKKLLQNPYTKESARKEHETYLEAMKTSAKIK